MPHPKVDNETPFVIEPLMLLDEAGRPALTLLARLGLAIGAGGALALLDEQPPVAMSGELYFPDAERSSYRYEPEIAPLKLATDVAVIAEAHAPGRPAAVVDVGVQVGPLVKHARVFGDRYWLPRGLGEHQLSSPQPFSTMPLCYERAFGGTVALASGGIEHEARNPVGCGLDVGGSEPIRAPNIEDPRAPISSVRDRPVPVGFGFTSPDWQPRVGLAGTYDATWDAERKPLLPRDFDLGFYSAASPGLVTPGYLRGDEHVATFNLSPEGRLDFDLPGIAPPGLRLRLAGQPDAEPALALDTLILDLVARRLSLLWRVRVALPRGFHSFEGLELTSDHPFDSMERAA